MALRTVGPLLGGGGTEVDGLGPLLGRGGVTLDPVVGPLLGRDCPTFAAAGPAFRRGGTKADVVGPLLGRGGTTPGAAGSLAVGPSLERGGAEGDTAGPAFGRGGAAPGVAVPVLSWRVSQPAVGGVSGKRAEALGGGGEVGLRGDGAHGFGERSRKGREVDPGPPPSASPPRSSSPPRRGDATAPEPSPAVDAWADDTVGPAPDADPGSETTPREVAGPDSVSGCAVGRAGAEDPLDHSRPAGSYG
ncbi:hypothetical protein ABT063_19785 [Streptomyces sp. NPDC002838]|uniref:hypothetical protein n=1 Tax=Streptomyces sp. NPDC002838 TaxID=3154436 RepID=UPI0033259D39